MRSEKPDTGDKVICAKVHRKGKEVVLAACDKELLGKTLEDGELEFGVNERFYGGAEVNEDEFRSLLNGCTIANLVGKRVVACAAHLVDMKAVISINGVPHIQIVKM